MEILWILITHFLGWLQFQHWSGMIGASCSGGCNHFIYCCFLQTLIKKLQGADGIWSYQFQLVKINREHMKLFSKGCLLGLVGCWLWQMCQLSKSEKKQVIWGLTINGDVKVPRSTYRIQYSEFLCFCFIQFVIK